MYRLLIVDDEVDILKGYARYFPWAETAFRPAYTAQCAGEALRILKQEPVDAVLCDIEMPGMSGIELIEQLRLIRPHLPVIVISGHDTFDYARRLLTSQITAYVLKSEKHAVLVDALRIAAKALDAPDTPDVLLDDDLMARIDAYIDAHLPTVSLGMIADAMHLSQGHLSRIFKEAKGETYQKHIIGRRVERSKALLLRGQRVHEVSAALGYADTQSFIRAFKSVTGLTPSRFLHNHRTGGRGHG